MREILFKAKRKDNGEWVEGNYGFFKSVNGNEKMHHITTESGKAIRIDPTTLCQFTGLTDKNGKKIFENDIIQTNGCLTWLIAYDKNAFVCKDSSMETYFALFEQWGYDWKNKEDISPSDTFEVIGNIYDDPELLGGKHEK